MRTKKTAQQPLYLAAFSNGGGLRVARVQVLKVVSR